VRDCLAATRLRAMIETMPADMQQYMGLTAIRTRLVEWLAG